ncbi:MAG: hypothetical protein HKN14_06565 [Marinicaulis sp.]|nr:hypothetical protein [Marinicaulis sp.]NNE40565.1 hypothetical protein [Marinicaulis sp.]
MSDNGEKNLNASTMTGRAVFVAWAILCAGSIATPSFAATASYVSPASMTEAERIALGTSGDSAGYLIPLDSTLELVFDDPFATSSGENVTIFSLPPPPRGFARAWVSFGVYNDGSPTIVRRRNMRAGSPLSISSLFDDGCSVFGGCDFISITTHRARRGAPGVEVDYVTVDGEVVEVTSPTPEPQTWALMILGFVATAMRLKHVRKQKKPDLVLA